MLLRARLTIFPRFEVLLNQVSLRPSGIAGSCGFVLVLCDLRQQDRLRLAAGTEDASLTVRQSASVQVGVLVMMTCGIINKVISTDTCTV